MDILDPKKVYIGDFVADAQRFVFEKNIMPSDQVEGSSVAYLEGAQEDKFIRVYNDGRIEPISREVFVDESIYNFLPARFKTYKPNG
jgi:hypothetical protein